MQADDVLRAFSANRFKGLSTRAAVARQLKNGNNVLWSTDLSGRYPTLLRQIFDYTTVLFILAVCLSAVFTGGTETVSVALLLTLSVALRTAVFFFAKNTYRRNARYMCPRCRVMRDGKCVYLFADQIVAGDILLFSPGDTVPCDTRLISGNLTVSELYLNRERRRIAKSAIELLSRETVWTDRKNILYATSTVLAGSGIGVVVSVGEQTLAYALRGRIPLPMEDNFSISSQITELSRAISLGMMIICGIYLSIGLFAGNTFLSVDMLFLSAIALLVASAGELLETLLHTAYAGALHRMSADISCVVKAPASVEKIAQLEWLIISGEHLLQTGDTYIHSWHDGLPHLLNSPDPSMFPAGLRTVCNCIQRCFSKTESLSESGFGDVKCEITDTLSSLRKSHNWPVLAPEGRCIGTSVCNGLLTSLIVEGDVLYAYVCGSVDDVIRCCSKIMSDDGVRPITNQDITSVSAFSHDCAVHARSTIAVAKRISPVNHLNRPSAVQNSMIYLGCIAISGTVDSALCQTVDMCREGGIRIALLCNDPLAAKYIAATARVYTGADSFVSGGEMEIADYLSGADTGNLLIHTSPDKRSAVVNTLREISCNAVCISDRVADLPLLKTGTALVVESDAESIVDVVSRGAEAILSVDASASGRAERAALRGALDAIAHCRTVVRNLFWGIMYLLIAQSSRAVLAMFAVCMEMPLLSSSHLLLTGCVLDFAAVAYIAHRQANPSYLSTNRKLICIPKWNTGILAAVGIGVLSGLLQSIATFLTIRCFAYFDAEGIETLRLFGVFSTSALAVLLCSDRVSLHARSAKKLNLSGLCAAIIIATAVTLCIYSFVNLHITDWRVWLSHCIPAIVTGVMLIFYRNTQQN